jgi:AcrR family transcriptional regulator
MPRAGLTPQRVIAEAAAVADDGGLDALTLAAVAQRFGVTLPSLYKHVSGIDGLRRDLAVLGMTELARSLAQGILGRSGRDALTALAHQYRSFARSRPGLYAASIRAPGAGDTVHQAAAQDALDVVVALVRSYGIDGDNTVHAIRTLRAALHGFVTLDTGGAFGMRQDVDASFEHLIDLLHHAFEGWGRGRS